VSADSTTAPSAPTADEPITRERLVAAGYERDRRGRMWDLPGEDDFCVEYDGVSYWFCFTTGEFPIRTMEQLRHLHEAVKLGRVVPLTNVPAE
jgi:hypothetical protein